MKLLLFILLFLWAIPSFGQGSFTAATCNQSDVNAVINGPTHTAVDGDTIKIPSGTCTWTTGVTIPSAIGITIIGSGTPNSTASTQGPSASCTATTITLAPASTTTAFFFKPSQGNSTTRWSCMQITYSSGPAIAMKTLGVCTSSGCPNLRVDNITFTSWAGHSTSAGISFGITAVSNMFGVWDHNKITGSSTSLTFLQLCECSMGNYLGTGNYGDNSWALSESYGSNQFIFFENNIFIDAGCCENEARVSTFNDQGGGRIVMRFNTITIDPRNSAATWHGTESNGRPRGNRAWEFYANTVTCIKISGLNCGSVVGPRSGTGLSWGNSTNLTGSAISNFLGVNTFRALGGTPNWGGACDGTVVWDTNDGGATPTIYFSGTVGSYNSGTKTITVAAGGTGTVPPWTTNQWSPSGAPYSVHNVTQSNGSEITANGSNTLTVQVGSGAPGDWTPAVNDSIQIARATACVDQGGGRGAGTLYSGLNGAGNAPGSPITSSAEVASPSYLWANPWTGGTPTAYVGADTGRVIANRDWYADAINQAAQSSPTSPFNGTSGTGYGTYARIPTSCTNGTAYWAEDQGSWNTTNTAIPGTGTFTQGKLYICSGGVFPAASSPNYTPYTYPHPLVSGLTTGWTTLGTMGTCSGSPTGQYTQSAGSYPCFRSQSPVVFIPGSALGTAQGHPLYMFSDGLTKGTEWGNNFYTYDPTQGTATGAFSVLWQSLEEAGSAGPLISTISRASGVVTLTVATTGTSPQSYQVGDWILPVGVTYAGATSFNTMLQVASVSNCSTANLLCSTFTANQTGEDGTGSGGTVQGEAPRFTNLGSCPSLPCGPVGPLPRHNQITVYDTTRNAVWLWGGICDTVASPGTPPTAVVVGIHGGCYDMYKMTKSGANWSFTQVHGFGTSAFNIASPNQSEPGLACSSGSNASNCGYKFSFGGYDPVNDVIVFLGGTFNSSPRNETYVYHPSTDVLNVVCAEAGTPTCSTVPQARQALGDSRMVSIGGGQLLLFGGQKQVSGGQNQLGDTWIFNTNTNAWSQPASANGTNPSPGLNTANLPVVMDWDPVLSEVIAVDSNPAGSHTWAFHPTTLTWTDLNISGGPILDNTNILLPEYMGVIDPDYPIGGNGSFIIVNLTAATGVKTFYSLNLPATANLNIATLTTQEALPYSGSYATGVIRTKEPASVGLPIPDSLNITSTSGLGCTGTIACGFRSLAKWPDGNIKWLEFYYLDSVAANGTDTSVILQTGTGGVGTNLATDNGTTISVVTGTGAGNCAFTIQKASFDVIHSAVCNSKTIVNGSSTGLILMGPTFGSSTTTCTYASTCTTAYQSSNDTASTCLIEQNSPVVAVVKCTGGLKDGSGNQYLGFLTRLYFYAGNGRVQATVSLKNDLDGASGSRNVSYMGYQSFGLSLATNLTGTNLWSIGDDGSTSASCGTSGLCSGTLSAGQSAYLYQGWSTFQGDVSPTGGGYNSSMQFGTIAQSNAAVDITRTNSGTVFTYAQDGYEVVLPAGTIGISAASTVTPTTPMCWADVYDNTGGQGIEFAMPYCAAQSPRSLQIQNGGLQLTAGISPDQSLWTQSCTGGISPCQKIYYQPWPYFRVADVFLIFHDSNTDNYSETSLTREQNEFLRMQYPLIARSTVSYYNSTNALPYLLPTASAVDTYFTNLVHTNVGSGTNITALTDSTFYVTRFFDWAQGGGGNQNDWRYGNIVDKWIERGFTSAYLFTRWWDRFQEQYAWERGDDVSCTVGGISYRGWSCHTPSSDLGPYVGEPSECTLGPANKCNDSGGLLPNNCTFNAGCVGGYVDPVADENSSGRHYHWWSAIYDYLMTGDEDLGDMIRNGANGEATAIGSTKNYTTLTANGNRASTPYFWEAWQSAGHNNQLGQSGSYGGQFTSLAEMLQFFNETGDTQDATFTQEVISNLLNVILTNGKACVTTGTGSINQNWPSGCTVNWDGSAVDQTDRGFSPYRGIFIAAGDDNNFDRAVPVAGNDVNLSGFVRDVEPFMEGYFVEGLWRLLNVEGTSWSFYKQLNDDTYGMALGTDNSNFISGLGAASPYPNKTQLVYTMALDQPNSLTWFTNDFNGFGPPGIGQLYAFLFNYLGSVTTYQPHFENNAVNLMSGATYNPNNITTTLSFVYGTQTWDTVVYYILNPPAQSLQTLCSGAFNQTGCSASFSAGQWTLSWPKIGNVSQYFLKENDTLTIVESIPWNEAVNQPVFGNTTIATQYPWAAASYTATQPAATATTITVTAPSTANFMLKRIGTGTLQASTPVFSLLTGTYLNSQSVSLSTTSGSVICWNTTGNPGTNGIAGCAAGSTLYTGPITVAASETVYAIAGGTGFTDSGIASVKYAIGPTQMLPQIFAFAGSVATHTLCTIVPATTQLCFANDCSCWWVSINGLAYAPFGVSSVNGKTGNVTLAIQ